MVKPVIPPGTSHHGVTNLRSELIRLLDVRSGLRKDPDLDPTERDMLLAQTETEIAETNDALILLIKHYRLTSIGMPNIHKKD